MASDIDKIRHESLDALKPVCMSLMQDCNKRNISIFISALSKVREDVAQEIQQFIIFPLQNALHKKNQSESTFCEVTQALDVVLEKTSILSIRMFMDLFNPIIYFISSPSNPSKVCVTSEETKASAVNTLSNLITASTNSVLNEVYSLPCLPAIGQLISLLLSLAQVERSRSLQIASMKCLEVSLQLDSKYGATRVVPLGNYFAFCLPGVTMAMTRIITGDQKQGSEVIKNAMSIWTKTVCLIMSDNNLEQARSKKRVTNPGKDVANGDKLNALVLDRNEEWVKTTASKLKMLLDQICKLNSHGNWRIRLSLVELAENILDHCSLSLSACVPKVLECLVALINDEYDNVSSKAFFVIRTFSQRQIGLPGERSLTEMLEENVYNLATSLPRQIRMCDEEEKLPLINLLKGYIMLLGNNIRCVINSSSHLRHLALALVQSLELDSSDGKILEERATLLDYEKETFIGDADKVWKPKKYFKHFREEDISSALLSVCRLLGQYGNLYILVDCFLDLFHESSVYKLPAILIINEVVYGAGNVEEKVVKDGGERVSAPPMCGNKLAALLDVIKMLLEEYVCTVSLQDQTSDNWSRPVHSPSVTSVITSLTLAVADHQDVSSSIVSKRNSEILLSCLFMEGVGKFATVLGGDFQVHLIETLYPLVENLGHENSHISSTAYDTLTHICTACRYRSIGDIIQANADYLISSVSLRLRHFEQNQRTPRLLSVMLRYSSQDLLPLVYHSIVEILESLDDHYSEDVVLFMPVLLEMTTAIGRWFPSTHTTKTLHSQATNEQKEIQSVACFVEEYIKLKRRAAMQMEDDEDVDVSKTRSLEDIEKDLNRLKKEELGPDREEDVEEEEEKQKESPQHIQVVKEVMARVKNLLSSHDPRVRVQALEVVTQGCKDLADHERELLPQIHQIWPGFYPRFHSEEKFVIIKALESLRVMAEVGGDFILHRVMKDVIPGLVQFMEKQAKISADSGSAYIHTPSFKLQLAILDCLGPLAQKLKLKDENLDLVAKICIPFLSDVQPLHLQKACLRAFTFFTRLDCDTIWLTLSLLYSPHSYMIPSPSFKPLPKSFQSQAENSYSKNITVLFETCYL